MNNGISKMYEESDELIGYAIKGMAAEMVSLCKDIKEQGTAEQKKLLIDTLKSCLSVMEAE